MAGMPPSAKNTRQPRSGIKPVKRALAILLLPLAIAANAAYGAAAPQNETENTETSMKIKISSGGESATATLDGTETAKDFAKLLPLKLTLGDFASSEKISDLPHRLSTKDAPEGYKPSAGDIAYYAPWGNIAFFYKDGGHSRGLVRLGQMDGDGIKLIVKWDSKKVRIEKAE